jgi:hypothetical protein
VLALGLGAVDVHADLPDHHLKDGKATVCIAALAIGVFAAVALAKRSRGILPWRWPSFIEIPQSASPAPACPMAAARAGPLDQTVLRL